MKWDYFGIPYVLSIGSLNSPILGGENVNIIKLINNMLKIIIELVVLHSNIENINLYDVYSPSIAATMNASMFKIA